jgi:hypothetical protein
MLAHHFSGTNTNSTPLYDVAEYCDTFRGILAVRYSTLSVPVPPPQMQFPFLINIVPPKLLVCNSSYTQSITDI